MIFFKTAFGQRETYAVDFNTNSDLINNDVDRLSYVIEADPGSTYPEGLAPNNIISLELVNPTFNTAVWRLYMLKGIDRDVS